MGRIFERIRSSIFLHFSIFWLNTNNIYFCIYFSSFNFSLSLSSFLLILSLCSLSWSLLPIFMNFMILCTLCISASEKPSTASSHTSGLIIFHTFIPSASNFGSRLFTDDEPDGRRIAKVGGLSEYLYIWLFLDLR